MKKVMKNIFVKLIFNILKNYMNFITFPILTRKNDEKESKGVEKLLANLRDKTEYVIHIRNLNQSLNHGSILKKLHIIIKFNRNAWLKPHIDMNTDLRKKRKKKDFERDFFK